MVEGLAARRCSTRQIVEAVRAYAADRAAVPRPGDPPLVWIQAGGPEWRAWQAHYRARGRRGPPIDKRGGWRFPSQWPPFLGRDGAFFGVTK